MNRQFLKRRGRIGVAMRLSMFVAMIAAGIFSARLLALPPQISAAAEDEASLVNAYRHVEVASVSDAVEQLLGRNFARTKATTTRTPSTACWPPLITAGRMPSM